MKPIFRRVASKISRLYSAEIFRGKLNRAMALHSRGGVRSDGLRLTSARTILRVEWLARELHPWDRDLPPGIARRRFSAQCLDDADAAIARLFAEIPALDSIEVCVRRTTCEPPLLTGTVERGDLDLDNHTSAAMKLRTFGLKFRLDNRELQHLGSD